MYIADMHCDSLLTVSGERGLINKYNFSDKNPQLQFVAHFCPAQGETAANRRKRLMNGFNLFLCERERLGLTPVSCGRDVFRIEQDELRGALLSVEGGGGLFADSPELDILAGAGLAVFGMAWDSNELCSGAFDSLDNGLTEQGRKMVTRLSELGITVDVSHLSDRSFYELFEMSGLPALATHSNFREVTDVPRNLTRSMAQMIAARGGVIGINLYPPFLSADKAGKEDILRHVDYGLELVGEDCIGFGFDIDGTDGLYPTGIYADSSIHEQVIDLLLSRYSTQTVEKIAGKNVLEFLKNNLM